MTKYLLDELRHSILQKVGIRVVCPSDCQVIAYAINKKLQKNISETTIKRLFGFAALHHKFSKFTINTLLEYVDDEYTGDIDNTDPIDEGLDYLFRKSRNLTEQTIRRITNSCTIPYALTIDRKFASHDFDYFYHSEFTFTVFTSQPGYGRSILLSHLVQNQFMNKEGKYNHDFVLFLHADKLFQVDHDRQNLEIDILKLLSINTNESLTSYFDRQYKKTGKKLIIIVDGFYDVLEHASKIEVFDSILQLLCDIEDSMAIKVVLSMRSYIWTGFFETIRHSHFLKSKWYTGSYFRLVDQSNVPVFTDAEVELLLSKISPDFGKELNTTVKSQFKHPFHLYYYYHLQNEYPSNEFNTNLIFHEITLRHLLNRVYQSKYGVEKLIFCKQFIQLTDYGKSGQKIDKNLLINEFTLFRNAYADLLMDGILIEEKQNVNGFLVETVRFVHSHIFEYFLFKELLEKYGRKMDESFFAFIHNEYEHNKQHYSMLEWSVFQFVKHRDFDLVKHLLNLKLPSKEQNQLLLFMAENIKHLVRTDPDAKEQIDLSILHHEIVKKLVVLDFLDLSYQKIIRILCETTSDNEILAIYHAILSLFECLTFDVDEIKNRFNQLQQLNFNKYWQITPLEFTESLLNRITGNPIYNTDIFSKIDDFEVYHQKYDSLEEENIAQMGFRISKFYLALSNWLFGIPSQHNIAIDNVYRSFPLIKFKSKSYIKYLFHILALEAAKNEPGRRADQLERILNHMHQTTLAKDSNSWSKLIYQLFLSYQYYNRKEYDLAIETLDRCMIQYRNYNYVLLELMAYQLAIKIYIALNDIDKINEYRCLVFSKLEKHNINNHLFDFEMQHLFKTF